jgi:aryl-phospho-beta-D-glucosidase BglC (GH1 family)
VHYPTVPEPGENVRFYASEYSSDIEGDIASYEWSFPEGMITHDGDASYTFTREGEYTVSLTVVDDTGLTASISRTIRVDTRAPTPIVGEWNLPLRTEGKSVLDALDGDVTTFLTGVAKMGTEYHNPAAIISREVDPNYFDSDAKIMASWGIKLSRVPFNWYWYMTDYQYRETMRELVDAYTSNGLLVLLDMHWYSYRGWRGQLPQSNPISKDTGWRLAKDAILFLQAAAHDFKYNPMVVGVEINEFRPKFPDDPTYNYLFKFELAKQLADEVHQVNPNLLIFMELGQDGFNSNLHSFDSVRPLCRDIVAEISNLVYAPHIYFSEDYGRWNIYELYANGDVALGKAEMREAMDAHYLYEQNYYNLPVVVTEFTGQSRTPQIITDEMDYCITHNWEALYWAWFRNNVHDEHLLLLDWVTPSPSGEAFRLKLTEIQ